MRTCILIFAIVFLVGLFVVPQSQAATKQVTFEWQQNAEDLAELDHWELFMSLDPNLPFDQWTKQGDIPYTGTPADWYDATFTITLPDGAETQTWFKMVAVSKAALASDPSEPQENAPTVFDFKAPAASTDLAAAFNSQTKVVSLTWTTNPADTDIAKQEVFKAQAAGGPYASIGTGSGSFNYQVQPADSGKWIYFVVVLTDNDGNYSANSNEVAVKLAMGVPFGLRVTVQSQ